MDKNKYSSDMKKQINDLLLKMQTGENCIGETANELLDLFSLSERYILVEWLNGKHMIDGSTYFDTKEECLEYYNNLPKLAGYDIEYTICRIRNAR